MSELKPCPFCGRAQLTDTDRGETNPYTGGTQSRACDWCSVSTTDWNNRPIEDALNAEIARLRDAARWIPVSERMPPENTDVFIKVHVNFTAYRSTHVATHYGGNWHTSRYLMDDDMVTHWMPIPELPEQDGEK